MFLAICWPPPQNKKHRTQTQQEHLLTVMCADQIHKYWWALMLWRTHCWSTWPQLGLHKHPEAHACDPCMGMQECSGQQCPAPSIWPPQTGSCHSCTLAGNCPAIWQCGGGAAPHNCHTQCPACEQWSPRLKTHATAKSTFSLNMICSQAVSRSLCTTKSTRY